MENKLSKRYGLFTAICMVVGIVIGSGIFFKAQDILNKTHGNVLISVLAWVLGGLVMIICSAQFAVMATKYEKVNGVVDYAEETLGKRYAYYVGWFVTTIYYPAMTSVLAWVSARYFGVLVGWDMWSSDVMTLAGFLLVSAFILNSLAPKIAGYFQVSTTVIKLIPLVLMVFVGTVAGLFNGNLSANFVGNAISQAAGGSELFAAICATAFAYEGWIIATSINSEIKDSKKNLPIALVLGAVIVVVIYVLYNIAIAGGATTLELQSNGATVAFNNIFGKVGGTILNVLVVVSCLGTLNGLMVGSTRGLYSVSVRGEGPLPKMFSQVDEYSGMPTNSSIFALFCCAFWLLYFYLGNVANQMTGVLGVFNFDSSELPVITIYALYIPMLIKWIIKEKDLGVFKRFILPILAIFACLFLVFVAVYSHGIIPFINAQKVGEFRCPVIFYFIIFAVVMLIGFLCSSDFRKIINKKSKNATKQIEE